MNIEQAKLLAEQEALAAVRALMEGRPDDALMMIEGSAQSKVLALMACGLAASVLKHSNIDGTRWLDQRQAALAAKN